VIGDRTEQYIGRAFPDIVALNTVDPATSAVTRMIEFGPSRPTLDSSVSHMSTATFGVSIE
jgi:hypothetical protein